MKITGDNSYLYDWIKWWNIDPQDLEYQVNDYNSLGITKSYRGLSSLWILASVLVIFFFASIGWIEGNAIFGAIVYLPLALLIYRGNRWAILATIILWSLDKAASLLMSLSNQPNVIIIISVAFWWSLLMKFLYGAFKVEQLRRKRNEKERIDTRKPLAGNPQIRETAHLQPKPNLRKIITAKTALIISGLFLISSLFGGLFYWYELRPAKIKQECSWVPRYEPARPAQEGKTKEEVIAELGKKEDNIFIKMLIESAKPVPSKGPEPARSWYEKATADEYTFCLHDHGL